MENCDFPYASYMSVLNACIANLPLPFSIITSKHTFEVGVQILFGFSMKLSIDLFQWESVGGIFPEWCHSLMHLIDTGRIVKSHCNK